ncbi:MAG: tryptophan synthase subunit alpha [Desulfurococcales archaeon]|nr:tryptophan synthase subunit alpha [Desulfurococcales archaeon]
MALKSPGFFSYWTLAYPSLDESLRVLASLSDCSDYLEVGLPTANPKYDGPTVKGTHRIAIEKAPKPLEPLKLLESLEKSFSLLAYLEDYEGVLRELLEAAASSGAMCVLLPDLPFEYPHMLDLYVEESLRAGLKPCFFASSRFPHRWLKLYTEFNPLYIYLGLQPATGVRLPVEVERNVSRAKSLVGDVYLLAGFSIRTPETARALISRGADGVVVGSAIIRKYEEDGLGAAAKLACSIARGLKG